MIKTTAAIAASLAGLFGTLLGFFTPDYDGPMRFESTTISVSADPALNIDLPAVTSAWGDRLTFVLTDGPADITFVPGQLEDMAGAEATRTFVDGNYIASCKVEVEANTFPILTHEFGHCLGLSHTNMSQGGSNMHWIAGDYQNGWSDKVMDTDLRELARHYIDN